VKHGSGDNGSPPPASVGGRGTHLHVPPGGLPGPQTGLSQAGLPSRFGEAVCGWPLADWPGQRVDQVPKQGAVGLARAAARCSIQVGWSCFLAIGAG